MRCARPVPQWERVGELAQMDKLFDANAEFKVRPATLCVLPATLALRVSGVALLLLLNR